MSLPSGILVNQRYEIRTHVGPDGPMEVYRALDLRMGREIALAVLDFAGMQDPEDLLDFESATQARGRTRHPNLAVLHDFGQEGSKVFIAAEWMGGESLRRRVGRQAMEWPEARSIALGLVKALRALGEQGLEVRDLDLSGVHLEPDGTPKLLAYWVRKTPGGAGSHPASLAMVGLLLEMVREGRRSVPSDKGAQLEAWEREGAAPDLQELEGFLAPPARRRSLLPWLLGGAAGLGILALGGLLLPREPEGRVIPKSVVVAPLIDESPHSENQYLAAGLGNLLVQSLSRSAELRVIPWTARSLRPQDPDLAASARNLGTELALGGRLRAAEGRLRVTLTLVRAQDGAVLWQEQFDRPTGDILALAGDLSRRADEILVPGNAPRPFRGAAFPNTRDPDAYRLYLQGRHWLTLREVQAFQRAQAAFQGAIARDPTFAQAYSGLADTYNLLAVWGSLSGPEAGGKAIAASQKALELAPDLSEAHASLAYARFRYLWDWTGGEESFRQALRLDPANAQAHHWFAYFLSLMGRWEESFDHFQRSLDLDPLNLPARVNYAVALHWAGREADALREFDRVLEQDPDFRSGTQRFLDTLERMGRFPEALSLLDRTEKKGWTTPEDVRHLRNAFESQGTAGYLAERIRQMERSGSHPIALAELVVQTEDRERVFRLLDRAVREQSPFAVWIPKDPAFARLRKEARFQELLTRIHYPGR